VVVVVMYNKRTVVMISGGRSFGGSSYEGGQRYGGFD